jgi:hypothetical protein
MRNRFCTYSESGNPNPHLLMNRYPRVRHSTTQRGWSLNASNRGVPMPEHQPACYDFCFNHDLLLFEGGFDPPARICGSCAAQAVAQTSPQPVPEPAQPPEGPSKESLLASIPSPRTIVAHLDQFVIGQNIAKRRLALGVANHYKRLVDSWDRGTPDPIITDADLRDVVVEKSNILPIGPSGSGKLICSSPWRVTSTSPSPSGMRPA